MLDMARESQGGTKARQFRVDGALVKKQGFVMEMWLMFLGQSKELFFSSLQLVAGKKGIKGRVACSCMLSVAAPATTCPCHAMHELFC